MRPDHKAGLLAVFVAAVGVASGFYVGYEHGKMDERRDQEDTRLYVNDRMSDAGFCRWLKVSKFPEHCAGLGK